MQPTRLWMFCLIPSPVPLPRSHLYAYIHTYLSSYFRIAIDVPTPCAASSAYPGLSWASARSIDAFILVYIYADNLVRGVLSFFSPQFISSSRCTSAPYRLPFSLPCLLQLPPAGLCSVLYVLVPYVCVPYVLYVCVPYALYVPYILYVLYVLYVFVSFLLAVHIQLGLPCPSKTPGTSVFIPSFNGTNRFLGNNF